MGETTLTDFVDIDVSGLAQSGVVIVAYKGMASADHEPQNTITGRQ